MVCIVLSLWTPSLQLVLLLLLLSPMERAGGGGQIAITPSHPSLFSMRAALPFFFFGCHGQGRPLRHGIVDPLMGGKRNLLSGRLLFFASSFAAQFLCGVVRLPPPSSKTHC